MRICYISNEFPVETGFGGIATYTKVMAEAMANRGHEIHVICRSATGEPRTVTENKVTVHRIGPGTYPIPTSAIFYYLRRICCALFPHSLVRLAWAKEAAATCKELIARHGIFDIVEYPECGGEGFYLCSSRETAAVARCHTPWSMVAKLDGIKELFSDSLLVSYLERRSVKKATAVTSPTDELAAILKKKWRLPAVTVFPNPLPVTDCAASAKTDWIYTGRVEHRKGVHVLVLAYAELCKSIEPPRLRLIGRPYGRSNDGREYGDYIAGLIRSNGLEKKIEWIKGVDQPMVKPFLALSSVAVFPSLWENLSYCCLEAMACGCAIVASRCGGFTELISHGESGMLFSPGCVDELSSVLRMLFEKPDFGDALGRAGRTRVIDYCDTETVCKKTEAVYLGCKQGVING
jgi:glycosyltransferase involved in cell wall biosynthesis